MECSPTTLQEMSFGIYKKIGTYWTDWFALNPSHLNKIVLSIPFDFLNLLAGPSLRQVTIRRGLFTCTLKL